MAVVLMERDLIRQVAYYYDDKQETSIYRVPYTWSTRDLFFPTVAPYLLVLSAVLAFYSMLIEFIAEVAAANVALVGIFIIVGRITEKWEMAALKSGEHEQIDLYETDIATLRGLYGVSMGEVYYRIDTFIWLPAAMIIVLLISLIKNAGLGGLVVFILPLTVFAEYEAFMFCVLRIGIKRKFRKTYMKCYESREVPSAKRKGAAGSKLKTNGSCTKLGEGGRHLPK